MNKFLEESTVTKGSHSRTNGFTMTQLAKVKLIKSDVYPCKRCWKAFMTCNELKRHATDNHMKGASIVLDRISLTKPYVCSRCGKLFSSEDLHKLHMLDHVKMDVNRKRTEVQSGRFVKRIKCDECDMKFVLESTLKDHMVLHEPMPYPCECGVGFYKENDLEQHRVYVHTTLKKCGRPRTKPFVPRINYKGLKLKENGVNGSYSQSEKEIVKKKKKRGSRSNF